ncbi:unnamed protein product [Effrenium voratum]|nr:unnamed protein product [Effrenium voratum]
MLSSMPGASLFASSSASPADAAGTAGRGGAVGEAWSGMLDTLRANLGTEQAPDAAPPPAAASSSAPAESAGMLSSMPGASLFASSSASPADASGTAGRGGAVGEAWSGMLDTLRANLGTEQAADAAPTAAASSSAPPESAGMLSSMPGASLFASSSASPADAAGAAGTAGTADTVGEAWSGMLDKLRANLGTEQVGHHREDVTGMRVKPSAPEGDGGFGHQTPCAASLSPYPFARRWSFKQAYWAQARSVAASAAGGAQPECCSRPLTWRVQDKGKVGRALDELRMLTAGVSSRESAVSGNTQDSSFKRCQSALEVCGCPKKEEAARELSTSDADRAGFACAGAGAAVLLVTSFRTKSRRPRPRSRVVACGQILDRSVETEARFGSEQEKKPPKEQAVSKSHSKKARRRRKTWKRRRRLLSLRSSNSRGSIRSGACQARVRGPDFWCSGRSGSRTPQAGSIHWTHGRMGSSAMNLQRCCLLLWLPAFAQEAFFELEAASRTSRRERPPCGDFPWCDTKLPLEQRVDLLVKELTPEEKILQLSNDLFGGVPAVERLGLSSYNYIREAAHGVLQRGGKPEATSFPQVVAMAASFNRSLFRRVGEAVGREARFMQDVGVMWGDYKGRYGGLVLQFNINLFRDPRWGRGQETPGESPELSAAFAEEYVKGIQTPIDGANSDSPPQAGASCKHYAAYSFEGGPTLLNRTTSMRQTLPGQSNISRHNENAIVSARDFAESYSVPWEACAKAKALGVMCAYNQVNGVPSCGNKRLLRSLLRDTWGFDGVVVTDCDSVSDMYALQNFKSTPSATVEAALDAGTDVACSPGFFKRYATPEMDALLTEAVKDAMRVRFRLGEFDVLPPYPTWAESSAGHAELALEASLQSAVLLKNAGRLPLQKGLRLAVLGPLRNATQGLLGNYQAWPVQATSPLEALGRVAQVAAHGPELTLCGARNAELVAQLSKPEAEAVLILAGLTGDDHEVQDPDLRPRDSHLCKAGCLEGEGCDRPNIALPADQEALVRKAASWGLPVVLAVVSGGALDLSSVEPLVDGIFWLGYPGQAGGLALAQLLVGEASPSGRLSQTFYRSEYLEHVPLSDYSFPARAADKYPGRGYRFVEDSFIHYPFGFGLSYDQFQYEWLSEEASGRSCSVRLRVAKESGSTSSGGTSVLFFLRPPAGPLLKRLAHFERVEGDREVKLTLEPKHFEVVDDEGNFQLVTGRWTLEVNAPADLSRDLVVTPSSCEWTGRFLAI